MKVNSKGYINSSHWFYEKTLSCKKQNYVCIYKTLLFSNFKELVAMLDALQDVRKFWGTGSKDKAVRDTVR